LVKKLSLGSSYLSVPDISHILLRFINGTYFILADEIRPSRTETLTLIKGLSINIISLSVPENFLDGIYILLICYSLT